MWVKILGSLIRKRLSVTCRNMLIWKNTNFRVEKAIIMWGQCSLAPSVWFGLAGRVTKLLCKYLKCKVNIILPKCLVQFHSSTSRGQTSYCSVNAAKRLTSWQCQYRWSGPVIAIARMLSGICLSRWVFSHLDNQSMVLIDSVPASCCHKTAVAGFLLFNIVGFWSIKTIKHVNIQFPPPVEPHSTFCYYSLTASWCWYLNKRVHIFPLRQTAKMQLARQQAQDQPEEDDCQEKVHEIRLE